MGYTIANDQGLLQTIVYLKRGILVTPNHLEKNDYFYRSLTLTTNFNPDHTSSTAQTLTSTNPFSKPKSRIIFSSKIGRNFGGFLRPGYPKHTSLSLDAFGN